MRTKSKVKAEIPAKKAPVKKALPLKKTDAPLEDPSDDNEYEVSIKNNRYI